MLRCSCLLVFETYRIKFVTVDELTNPFAIFILLILFYLIYSLYLLVPYIAHCIDLHTCISTIVNISPTFSNFKYKRLNHFEQIYMLLAYNISVLVHCIETYQFPASTGKSQQWLDWTFITGGAGSKVGVIWKNLQGPKEVYESFCTIWWGSMNIRHEEGSLGKCSEFLAILMLPPSVINVDSIMCLHSFVYSP